MAARKVVIATTGRAMTASTTPIEATATAKGRIPGFSPSRIQGRHHGRMAATAEVVKARAEVFGEGSIVAIQDGKIVIVDESTGRPMPMRSWGEGLHQAIEAKENVELTPPNETIARMSFQRFFRLFKRLSGMSGTANEGAGEFWKIYQLPVMQIPTHRPCIREHLSEQVFKNQKDKWSAILDEIIKVHATDRPILVGTRTIQSSEHLAGLLKERKIAFNLLNATNTKDEASIVANAGHRQPDESIRS